jgi:hypothetical protein
VQEYKVITQNFKAEYEKASSAVVTAVTKSGGNAFHGDALVLYQGKDMVSLDPVADARGDEKPDYKRFQALISGPIIGRCIFASYSATTRTASVGLPRTQTAPRPASGRLDNYPSADPLAFRLELTSAIPGSPAGHRLDGSYPDAASGARLQAPVYEGAEDFRSTATTSRSSTP